LGRKKSEDAVDALAGLRQRLDDAKVSRKEYEPALKRIAQKGIMEDLKAEIASALSIVRDDVSDEVVNKVVASALGLLLSDESDVPEEIAADETVDEALMEDGDEEDIIEEELMSKGVKELAGEVREQNTIIKALLNERGDSYDDLFEIAKEAVTALQGQGALLARIEKMEKQLNARPRRASESDSTVLDGDNAKKIKSKIDKGLQEKDAFWNG
jgi:hypothetical protein